MPASEPGLDAGVMTSDQDDRDPPDRPGGGTGVPPTGQRVRPRRGAASAPSRRERDDEPQRDRGPRLRPGRDGTAREVLNAACASSHGVAPPRTSGATCTAAIAPTAATPVHVLPASAPRPAPQGGERGRGERDRDGLAAAVEHHGRPAPWAAWAAAARATSAQAADTAVVRSSADPTFADSTRPRRGTRARSRPPFAATTRRPSPGRRRRAAPARRRRRPRARGGTGRPRPAPRSAPRTAVATARRSTATRSHRPHRVSTALRSSSCTSTHHPGPRSASARASGRSAGSTSRCSSVWGAVTPPPRPPPAALVLQLRLREVEQDVVLAQLEQHLPGRRGRTTDLLHGAGDRDPAVGPDLHRQPGGRQRGHQLLAVQAAGQDARRSEQLVGRPGPHHAAVVEHHQPVAVPCTSPGRWPDSRTVPPPSATPAAARAATRGRRRPGPRTARRARGRGDHRPAPGPRRAAAASRTSTARPAGGPRGPAPPARARRRPARWARRSRSPPAAASRGRCGRVQARGVERGADDPAGVAQLAVGRAADGGAAVRRAAQPEQDPQRGRAAGAVRAEQGGDGPGLQVRLTPSSATVRP